MPPPRRPEALVGRVFRGADALTAGLLTRDSLRSSAWCRLYRGVYADADLPPTFDLRIAGASLLVPSAGVFSGRTAAYLHGARDLVDAGTPVEVSVPPAVRFGPVAGLRIRRIPLPDPDVVVVRRRRCTTGLRTALDIARVEPLVEGVVALDVLLGLVVVGRGELAEGARSLGRARGARRAQRAVAMADPRSESQPETRLRVLMALAGLVATPQHTIRDAAGEFVARVDLAFVEQPVAIEYDGAWHAEPGQFGVTAVGSTGWWRRDGRFCTSPQPTCGTRRRSSLASGPSSTGHVRRSRALKQRAGPYFRAPGRTAGRDGSVSRRAGSTRGRPRR